MHPMLIPEPIFAAAQAGDPRSLELLLRDLKPNIRRYAAYKCQASTAIDDVVQEALIILHRRIHTVRSLATLGAWLATIVARLCLLPALMFIKGVDELRSIDDSLRFSRMSTQDLRIDLMRALESLSEPHRQIVLLRDFEEMTIAEMAEALQLTRAATKSRLHRARMLMREFLAPDESAGSAPEALASSP